MYQPGANHGTACAGVIAAEVDAVLTVGAAPGCRLLPIKWESSGPSLLISDSKFRAALDFMADKVDVVSNSWGNSPDMNFSTSVLNRMRQLSETGGRRGRGIVFLFAAGNENCPIQHTGTLDIPFTDGWNPTLTVWIGVETSRVFEHNLTTIPGVMHVAALASHAQRSHYSNYGTGIGICAPSNNVHEYRRMQVTGLGITTAKGTQITSITDTFGGTSSATPLVAGIAALVISANPELTALEVIGVLKQTAAKDLDTAPYPQNAARSLQSEHDLGHLAGGALRQRRVPEHRQPGRNVESVVRPRPRRRASRRGGGAAAACTHPAGLAARELTRAGHSRQFGYGCAGFDCVHRSGACGPNECERGHCAQLHWRPGGDAGFALRPYRDAA